MSADEFQVDPVVDHFGQVPENLLFDSDVSDAECRLFAVLTTYDWRGSGECYPTQETLGKRLGWSHRTVKRVIGLLSNRGAIEVIRRRREPAIYRLRARLRPILDGPNLAYQEPLMGQTASLDGPTGENTPLTNERKNERPPRASRIPIPFYVDEAMYEWADRECAGVNIDRETEKFVDHFRAKSGKDASKVDWGAAWKNWLRRAQEGWK